MWARPRRQRLDAGEVFFGVPHESIPGQVLHCGRAAEELCADVELGVAQRAQQGGHGGAILSQHLQCARAARAGITGGLLGVDAVEDLHGQGRQRLSVQGQLNEAADAVVQLRHVIGDLAGCARLTGRGHAPCRVAQTFRRRQEPAGHVLERCRQSLSALCHYTPRFAHCISWCHRWHQYCTDVQGGPESTARCGETPQIMWLAHLFCRVYYRRVH